MKKIFLLAVIPLLALAAGCTVRTYSVTRDRVDQDLYSGNKGYLIGQAPQGEEPERRMTRKTHVMEIELGPKTKVKKVEATGSVQLPEESYPAQTYAPREESAQISPATQTYKAQKGDTLQKISQKFYGTTKKWHKIYKANEDTLKSPDRLRPGMTLNIPVDGSNKLKEPSEKLK